MKALSIPQLLSTLTLALIAFFLASYLSAWSGPTSAPPSGNVAAPVNVGTASQIKDGTLGLDGLAVFGNTILSGADLYFNFGTVSGFSGYGFRDNSGTLEYKNSDGSWQAFSSGGGGGSSSVPDCALCIQAGVQNNSWGVEKCVRFNGETGRSSKEANFDGRGTDIRFRVACPASTVGL